MKKLLILLFLSLGFIGSACTESEVDKNIKKLKKTNACEGCILKGADLSEANLAGANLTGSNLIGVNLAGANLSGATLKFSMLTGANLAGANLSGADLRASFAPVSIENFRVAPLRFAPARFTPIRFEPVRFAPARFASLRSAPFKIQPSQAFVFFNFFIFLSTSLSVQAEPINPRDKNKSISSFFIEESFLNYELILLFQLLKRIDFRNHDLVQSWYKLCKSVVEVGVVERKTLEQP
jgi:hypothetical protein